MHNIITKPVSAEHPVDKSEKIVKLLIHSINQEKKMKFVETLGRHQGQRGVFQYKRANDGIHIDWSISAAGLQPQTIFITNAQWTNILTSIRNSPGKTFGLTIGGGGGNPMHRLYDIIEAVLPGQNPSIYAYVSAILEHEGSLEIYTGGLGAGHTANITLTKDF